MEYKKTYTEKKELVLTPRAGGQVGLLTVDLSEAVQCTPHSGY
jgi:hypothetical protein